MRMDTSPASDAGSAMQKFMTAAGVVIAGKKRLCSRPILLFDRANSIGAAAAARLGASIEIQYVNAMHRHFKT